MRGIAREADVDPSLIVHFFGTKAGLFAAVVEWPYDSAGIADQLRQVPIDQLGETWARMFIANWKQDGRRNPVVSLVRAALADETAAALLREFITVNFALPLVKHAGGDHPQLRAALLASQLVGFGLARYAIGFEALVAAPEEQIVAILGENIQRWCTGPLPGPSTKS